MRRDGLSLTVLLFTAPCALALSACDEPAASSDAAIDDAAIGMDSGARDGAASDTGAPDTGPRIEDAASDAGPIGSVGCVSGAGLPEGENTLTVQSMSRRFVLRLPAGYSTDRAWPVVLALHGNGGSPDYWDGTSGARNLRAVLEDHAILVIAHAIDGQWRDYGMDASTWPARVASELAYFDDVLSAVRAELCVDEDAIFAMGFSGGGSFSGVLGCRRTDIRAIAVGGSVIYFDEADCVGTPAAWITIGEGELSSGRTAYRDFFRDRAGCAASSTPTEPDPPCVTYDGCRAGTPVHYCEHPDGHVWPDFGSQAAWDFFGQFVD